MILWDFGIINAIKQNLDIPIFPSEPPKGLNQKTYLVFNLKNIVQGMNLTSKMEFSLTIVDKDETTDHTYAILKKINRLISSELSLYQGNFIIGSAKVKINCLENKKNMLILNLVAKLQLKRLYDDGEYNELQE